MFGGSKESLSEDFFTGTTGGRQFKMGECLLCFPSEFCPVRLSDVGESAMRGFWEIP